MQSPLVVELAGRLMRCPAAPYHEHAVAAEVKRICDQFGLKCRSDSFGNIFARLQTAPKQRLLALSAHMDHPGFRIVRRLGPSKFLAEFLGGVPDSYFKPRVPLRIVAQASGLPDRRRLACLPARLGRRVGKKKYFEVLAAALTTNSPQFAVWELEDFAIRSGRIIGRSCDDLVGVASALAALVELKRQRARVNIVAVITRAEEIGFQGALALIARKSLPKSTLVISLETSRELPPVKMRAGVIIRVGDKSSVFDPEVTRFLCEAANDLVKRDGRFHFQRALMSGGTCEATAYQELGYQTGAVCVALGNYHNCSEREQIRAEYVSVSDAQSMVRLLMEAARRMPHFQKLVGRLPARLRALAREGMRKLKRVKEV